MGLTHLSISVSRTKNSSHSTIRTQSDSQGFVVCLTGIVWLRTCHPPASASRVLRGQAWATISIHSVLLFNGQMRHSTRAELRGLQLSPWKTLQARRAHICEDGWEPGLDKAVVVRYTSTHHRHLIWKLQPVVSGKLTDLYNHCQLKRNSVLTRRP